MKTSIIFVVLILCVRSATGRFLNTGAQGILESSFYGRAPRKSRASMPAQAANVLPQSRAYLECVIRRRCPLTRKPRSLESSINGKASRKSRAVMPMPGALPQAHGLMSRRESWIQCVVRGRCPYTQPPTYTIRVIDS